jgi:hypothetical protein
VNYSSCFRAAAYNLARLKKLIKVQELETGPKEDTVELNQREKDEGDLFGIRAIEAGFYAGVAQSRPTSRAGSVIGHPGMSTSTLVGGASASSPLMKGHSANTSVLSLNLGQDNSSRRISPPNMKLRPSEAELTGKHGAVDMSLQVPPSPGIPKTQSFGGSDDGSSDGFTTPRSVSPRPTDFHPQHYAPAPMIPMPDALQVTYHDVQDNARSQAASFNNTPSQSPTPPYPGKPPVSRLPTLPQTVLSKGSRSPSPESNYPRVRVEHSSR